MLPDNALGDKIVGDEPVDEVAQLLDPDLGSVMALLATDGVNYERVDRVGTDPSACRDDPISEYVKLVIAHQVGQLGRTQTACQQLLAHSRLTVERVVEAQEELPREIAVAHSGNIIDEYELALAVEGCLPRG